MAENVTDFVWADLPKGTRQRLILLLVAFDADENGCARMTLDRLTQATAVKRRGVMEGLKVLQAEKRLKFEGVPKRLEEQFVLTVLMPLGPVSPSDQQAQ